MAFHIRNPETDALARKVASLKGVGLTETVHAALANELECETEKLSIVARGVRFAQELRARSHPSEGFPRTRNS